MTPVLFILTLFSSAAVVVGGESVRTLTGCGDVCGRARPPFQNSGPPHADMVVQEDEEEEEEDGEDEEEDGEEEEEVEEGEDEEATAEEGGGTEQDEGQDDSEEEATKKGKTKKKRKKKGKKSKKKKKRKKKKKSAIADEDTRIVNGYDPSERPWLVLLDIAGGSCGGAVVNTRYVLSAAHCFCRQSEPIFCKEVEVDGQATHQVNYDVRKHVRVYVGLNNLPLARKDDDPALIYGVESAVIRSGWIFSKTFSPDLALARLDRRIVFGEYVSPICLPARPGDVDDVPRSDRRDMKAYVAGWGATFSQCDSNFHGPAPHTMCKFPFAYGGRVYEECARTPPPSADNRVCDQFFRWAKIVEPSFDARDRSKTYSIFLWDFNVNRARVTTCYSAQPSQHGWCGTCYPGDELSPGQEGYCDKYHGGTEKRTRAEMGRPTPDSNWGWCSRWCSDRSGPAASPKLQETQLDVLTGPQCDDFGRALEANSTVEVCTGKKTPFEDIYQFRRVVTSDKKVFFRTEGRVENRLGIEDTKYDFYLGGTDSCQGDSGGPLYRWYRVRGELRAFVIGAVSRGTGCANFNQPGIFSRITRHLDWIRKVTADGNCDRS